MATNNDESIVTKALKLWIELKLVKGAVKLIAPLAVAGAGYFLYKKYKNGDASITS